MDRRNIRRITRQEAIGFVVLGCVSPVFVTPPPSVSAPGSIETIIAGTAAAAQTQTALHIPPSSTPTFTHLATKTITLTPSPTATVLLITETSVPEGSLLEESSLEEESESGGSRLSSAGPSETVMTGREWTCRVLSKSPAKDTVMPNGAQFKASWTVQNTGTKTWPKKGVDIVYETGADLRDGRPYLDIPTTVRPGGKVTLAVTLTAPKRRGEYGTRWTLKVGQTEFCGVKFSIVVK